MEYFYFPEFNPLSPQGGLIKNWIKNEEQTGPSVKKIAQWVIIAKEPDCRAT
jgi:hypothetical protein